MQAKFIVRWSKITPFDYRFDSLGALINTLREKERHLEIQGLLFDLDGTLIYTQKANMNAYNVALHEYGLRFTLEEFETTNGADSRSFLTKFFPELLVADIDKIRRVKSAVYKEFLSETYLNQVLLNFIDKSIGDKSIGIVTTGKKVNVFDILEFHGVRDKFDLIVTGDDVKNTKPNPEPYLKAIEIIGLQPRQILAFEDSRIGCYSAIAAGLQVIRVSNGFTHDK